MMTAACLRRPSLSQVMIRRAFSWGPSHGETANVAVIGAGWWSQGWHLPQLHRNENVKVAAIVDTSMHPTSNLNPNLEPLSVLAERYEAPLFKSVTELLTHAEIGPTLDGAIVATPHATHCEVGQELLEEGMRRKRQSDANNSEYYRPMNILMEKPMTTNVHEGKKLHDLVTEYQNSGGRACFLVNHSANYRIQARTARSLVESGEIGNVRHVAAFMASPLSWIFEDPANKGWNEPTAEMLGNGFCWGQCSHLLGWIYHVCPQLVPHHVYCAMNHSPVTGADVSHAATVTCNEAPDNNNVILSISGTSLLPGNAHADPPVGKQVRIKIFGTKGALIYQGDDQNPSSGRLELRRVDSNGQVEYPCDDDVGFDFENLDQGGTGPESLQCFIDACLGRTDYYVGAGSRLGLLTVQTLEAMYRSDSSRKQEDVMYLDATRAS